MIFLIEYNRPKEAIVKFERFKNSERTKAEDRRFEIELDLNQRKVNHEVVLLEAYNENGLRRTHKRYFQSLEESLKEKK